MTNNISERKLKRKSSAKKKGSIAYSIPSLPFGITLNVRQSANAWWMDQAKVHQLFAAFSYGATISEACRHVNLTEKQYKYFVSTHPEISEIRKGFLAEIEISARMTIINRIKNGDVKAAWKWLEAKVPEEFGRNPRIKNAGLTKWERENGISMFDD